MKAEITDSLSYGGFLDTLMMQLGKEGDITVSLLVDGVASADFRIRKSDLYLTHFKNAQTGDWVEFAENYNAMAAPDRVTNKALRGALVDSATWPNTGSAGVQRQLRLVIFAISEAARFMVVRFAVNRALKMYDEFKYADFGPIVTNWSSIRERTKRGLVTVADIQAHLHVVSPTWSDSDSRANLLKAHLLF